MMEAPTESEARRSREAFRDEFAAKYGPRFEPNPLLRKKAENGETF